MAPSYLKSFIDTCTLLMNTPLVDPEYKTEYTTQPPTIPLKKIPRPSISDEERGNVDAKEEAKSQRTSTPLSSSFLSFTLFIMKTLLSTATAYSTMLSS
ncbi:hypothetical protein LshimejAT787_0503690 [Lyophyllum shimeji]|uniref:Uncharacterized protein n=1 Tax=Lyophyllum shimeji TaxID=47721 RepID=A0A9P3PN63_LYOSH|nr:hypothetical protein LshimejAT787_0503690 [Lyophyllum shimeji]